MKSIQFLLDPTTQRCDLKQYTHSESAAKNDYSYVNINNSTFAVRPYLKLVASNMVTLIKNFKQKD